MRDDVRKFYHSRGTEIQFETDQDSTDFMKCIDLVRIKEKETFSKYDVLAIGTSGGRLDQIMSNIHYLYKLKDERKIYLLSDKNMSFLLNKVRNIKINMNSNTVMINFKIKNLYLFFFFNYC